MLPDILIETFCGFPSVSTIQYLQDSNHINHCLLIIRVRLVPSQQVTFNRVHFLITDSPRY
jgi:hypothetical protein